VEPVVLDLQVAFDLYHIYHETLPDTYLIMRL